MKLIKIFKKYKFVILFVMLVYLLTSSKENLSTSYDLDYMRIIKSICSGVSNKNECVESYKISCKENVCRGKVGKDKNICKTMCNNIYLE